jgi:hypothetical protein
MKLAQRIVMIILTLAGAAAAHAQFVKGNEAVRVMPDGTKKIETPPLPSTGLAAPCPATRPGCAGGGWLMVETSDGLRECTEIYARSGTCRASTYGAEKRSRLWIVKTTGRWMQCQRPDLASKCVSTKDLPYSEVQ